MSTYDYYEHKHWPKMIDPRDADDFVDDEDYCEWCSQDWEFCECEDEYDGPNEIGDTTGDHVRDSDAGYRSSMIDAGRGHQLS